MWILENQTPPELSRQASNLRLQAREGVSEVDVCNDSCETQGSFSVKIEKPGVTYGLWLHRTACIWERFSLPRWLQTEFQSMVPCLVPCQPLSS